MSFLRRSPNAEIIVFRQKGKRETATSAPKCKSQVWNFQKRDVAKAKHPSCRDCERYTRCKDEKNKRWSQNVTFFSGCPKLPGTSQTEFSLTRNANFQQRAKKHAKNNAVDTISKNRARKMYRKTGTPLQRIRSGGGGCCIEGHLRVKTRWNLMWRH